VQLDLIERRIAWNGRFMSVRLRSEIEVSLAGHDDVHCVMESRNGEFVGRIQVRLRRDEGPGANTGVGGSRLKGGKQCEQREFKN
jgi:hypothetical protein